MLQIRHFRWPQFASVYARSRFIHICAFNQSLLFEEVNKNLKTPCQVQNTSLAHAPLNPYHVHRQHFVLIPIPRGRLQKVLSFYHNTYTRIETVVSMRLKALWDSRNTGTFQSHTIFHSDKTSIIGNTIDTDSRL